MAEKLESAREDFLKRDFEFLALGCHGKTVPRNLGCKVSSPEERVVVRRNLDCCLVGLGWAEKFLACKPLWVNNPWIQGSFDSQRKIVSVDGWGMSR